MLLTSISLIVLFSNTFKNENEIFFGFLGLKMFLNVYLSLHNYKKLIFKKSS